MVWVKQSHGQHGPSACSQVRWVTLPTRPTVMKGMRMAGRMGNDRVKLKGLKVVKNLRR